MSPAAQERTMTLPRRPRLARGQSLVEYVTVSASLLGFTVLGWPFLVELLAALHRYFASIYYVIQCPAV